MESCAHASWTTPLVAHKLTVVRDQNIPSPVFRQLTEELDTLLAHEATREVRTEAVEIETPITKAIGSVVGLDTWVRRRLASAARRGDQIDLNALEALQGAADAGSIVVPITPTTCHECRDAV